MSKYNKLPVALVQERNHGDAEAHLAVIEPRVAEALCVFGARAGGHLEAAELAAGQCPQHVDGHRFGAFAFRHEFGAFGDLISGRVAGERGRRGPASGAVYGPGAIHRLTVARRGGETVNESGRGQSSPFAPVQINLGLRHPNKGCAEDVDRARAVDEQLKRRASRRRRHNASRSVQHQSP